MYYRKLKIIGKAHGFHFKVMSILLKYCYESFDNIYVFIMCQG